MERLQAICRQVSAGPAGLRPQACAGTRNERVEQAVRRIREGETPLKQRERLFEEIRRSGDRLMKDGEWPVLSLFDAGLVTGHDAAVLTKEDMGNLLDEALQKEDLRALEVLPGPWQDAKTRDERVALLLELMTADEQGYQMFLFARYMQQYGDRGLSSNIVVPTVAMHGTGSDMQRRLFPRVIVGDPADAERLSRVHVRKEGNFCPIVYDSVIATDDNEKWQAQRKALQEAFLPLSSLAEILPRSLERARGCAERLAQLAAGGEAVDMNNFLLHEAQAQLQLALLGCPEEFMEATNAEIRATFSGQPGSAEIGSLTAAMQTIMQHSRMDPDLALPTESRPVCGPLSRVVGTSDLPESANFGNMLVILFAGHDTTGHTMTWLLFELARHPEHQRTLQWEVDAFFATQQGQDPKYRDLARLEYMDRCITETLRLWPVVANGTFRRLQFGESISGPGGRQVDLPRDTPVQVANWPRHRNPKLWGPDADRFNPLRDFRQGELVHVGCPMAAANPESERFSPFAFSPRSCLGRNFAQMEMRLIMLYLLRRFEFSLAPPYDQLGASEQSVATPREEDFRGINRGTMGPKNLGDFSKHPWGTRHATAMKLHARPRPHAAAAGGIAPPAPASAAASGRA